MAQIGMVEMGDICEVGDGCSVSGGVMKRQSQAYEIALDLATALNPIVRVEEKAQIRKLREKAQELTSILKNSESEAWL